MKKLFVILSLTAVSVLGQAAEEVGPPAPPAQPDYSQLASAETTQTQTKQQQRKGKGDGSGQGQQKRNKQQSH